jgi:hypothetical protein
MTSCILVFACLVVASTIGYSGSQVLHQTAAENFATSQRHTNSWFANLYGLQNLISDCKSGRFSAFVGLCAQVSGIFAAGLVWSISLSSDRAVPLNGTFVLYFASLVTLVLYIFTFSLHFNNAAGDFSPHPPDSFAHTRRCLLLVREAAAVSVDDLSALFDNHASISVVGQNRGRTLSENSHFADLMERGQPFEKAK